MPKGGRRPGAGSPYWKAGVPQGPKVGPGEKGPGAGRNLGGQPKGRKNKLKSAEILTRAFAEGIMPLELLIQEMRRMYADGTEDSLREARMLAQAAAPYCHPRLQAVMAQTTLNSGDTLAELLEAIDGTTTGITNGADGEQTLAPKQSLLLPN
jgi:hypothetical protein